MWPKRNMSRLLIVAVSGIVFLTGCGLMPKEEEVLAPPLSKPQKQEYEVFEAKKKDITKEIKGNGYFISTNESDLFSKENGKRVKKVNVKFGDTVKKGDVLIELDSGNIENDLKLEKINLQRAQINLDRALQGNDEYDKKLRNLDLQAETIRLQQMENQLAASRLTAPVSGKVTFVEAVKEGDVIEAYKPLATIADPNSLQVTYTPSAAADIKQGMKVQLNYYGKNLEGVVSLLPTTGKRKNTAIIDFNGKIDGAKIDDSVEVSIIMDTKKDTIVIPKIAIKSYVGSKNVEILDNDKKISIEVETGIETSSDIEILSGLKEGQKVILR